ncbi:MAG TPA: GNAT family protein [bacterium]|nr:GNAT family protein [bacterium]HPL95736.1 GNAT family protein [bacterium]
MSHIIQHPIFIQGHKTILRPPCKETDLDFCYFWLNDPEVTRFLTFFLPQSKTEESQWFDALSNKKDNIVLAIETIDDRKFIGIMGLHRIDWCNRIATTGAFIGDRNYWGQGYGTDAKMFLLAYAFNQLNLHKICSQVIEYNERSLNYSLHCGYQHEGRLRQQVFKHGRYWDLILLGLFKKEWLPIWRKYQKTGQVKVK